MKYREWHNNSDADYRLPKAQWGEGPWQSEPDAVQWPDPLTNLPCLTRRGPGGHWCGYVAVPPEHPWFEKDYDDVDVEVHGDLTFAGFCDGEPGTGICHVPDLGDPDPAYWLGFDLFTEGTYRTLEFVKAECAGVAAQIVAAGRRR